MNDLLLDKFMKLFHEIRRKVDMFGYSELDYSRLLKLRMELNSLLKYMKTDMENDDGDT